MQYLKNNLVIGLLLLASTALGQDTNVPSNLKDFEGIWHFIPPKWSKDTTFTAIDIIKDGYRLDLFYWHKSKELSVDKNSIGFMPKNRKIFRLSELEDVGQRMYFYRPNPKAPNDSLKYFEQASPSCFASFNGLGTDNYEPPIDGEPNYFLFNFNGREYEYHRQIHHLPNYIASNLVKNKGELLKIELFLNKKYALIKIPKAYIFDNKLNKTKMYLLKNDPVEVVETNREWLKINYYPEKNGEWGGKTIEGWIKKSEVE